MVWFYSWVLLLFVHPRLWVVIIGSRGSLGLLRRPLLFLSANVESIFKVAMETIVFVVAVIGAAGRARLCYFCHESTPDMHVHTHRRAHTQTHRCVGEWTHMQADSYTHTRTQCRKTTTHTCSCFNHTCFWDVLHKHVCHLASLLPDILIHLHHDNSSKLCLLNLSTQMHHGFWFSSVLKNGLK